MIKKLFDSLPKKWKYVVYITISLFCIFTVFLAIFGLGYLYAKWIMKRQTKIRTGMVKPIRMKVNNKPIDVM